MWLSLSIYWCNWISLFSVCGAGDGGQNPAFRYIPVRGQVHPDQPGTTRSYTQHPAASSSSSSPLGQTHQGHGAEFNGANVSGTRPTQPNSREGVSLDSH